MKQEQKLQTDTVQGTSRTNVNASTKEASFKQHNEQYITGVWIRGNQETGYYATCGNARVTDAKKNIREIKQLINNPSLELTMRIISVMISTASMFQEKNINNEQIPIPTRQPGRTPEPIEGKFPIEKTEYNTTRHELSIEEQAFHKQNNQRHIKDALSDYND